MSEQQRKLKTWQGWALFGGAMLIVFCLGLLAASRRSGKYLQQPPIPDEGQHCFP